MITISTQLSGHSNGGLYNVITIPSNAISTDINTFNSSLCAVIATSSSKGTLGIYRPTVALNPFSTFEPENGYIVIAHENFVLTLSAHEASGSNTSVWDSTEPVELFVDDSTGSVSVNSEDSYYFTIDDNLPTFTMLVDGISGITFTNYFNVNDYNDCKLGISIADPALIKCDATEVYTTQSVEFSTVNDDVFTFYYYTTGSVLAGMSKKGSPLTFRVPDHNCLANTIASNKAYWNSSVTNNNSPCIFDKEDLVSTSTLKGRLRTGWVCRDVDPPLSIEAVREGRWYRWSYGILNGAPEDRVYSIQRYYDRFLSLACPYYNIPGYRKGSHIKWATPTAEKEQWLVDLQIGPVPVVLPTPTPTPTPTGTPSLSGGLVTPTPTPTPTATPSLSGGPVINPISYENTFQLPIIKSSGAELVFESNLDWMNPLNGSNISAVAGGLLYPRETLDSGWTSAVSPAIRDLYLDEVENTPGDYFPRPGKFWFSQYNTILVMKIIDGRTITWTYRGPDFKLVSDPINLEVWYNGKTGSSLTSSASSQTLYYNDVFNLINDVEVGKFGTNLRTWPAPATDNANTAFPKAYYPAPQWNLVNTTDYDWHTQTVLASANYGPGQDFCFYHHTKHP